MDQINEAFERMERSDVRYRFLLDMASLSEPIDVALYTRRQLMPLRTTRVLIVCPSAIC